jgi:hypothetical protein
MPAVESGMLFDMAVFDSRVLRDVPRTGFPSFHSFVHRADPLEFTTYYLVSDATPLAPASVGDHFRESRAAHQRVGGHIAPWWNTR